jgi:primosomal protein N' (replication factor Y)
MKNPRDLKISLPIKGQIEIQPNEDQFKVIEEIKLKLNGFFKFLIHGVTGSGKTIIYIELIKELIKQKRSVLFLLPEINLTPQFVKTFSELLNVPVLLYHSEITNSQKDQIWRLARDMDGPYVVLGVRSAVFIPIKNLGLIIIDEEHDQSFKQDDRCTYNARDVAYKKAQLHHIPIVLGSATPSLETFYSFQELDQSKKKFSLVKRAQNSSLPRIDLIDSREKSESSSVFWPLDLKSIDLITKALEKKEQVLVFINRLGYSTFIQCRSCGSQFQCPNCSIVLRYYKQKNELACHHCEYKQPMPKMCQSCGCMTMMNKGFGTEKVQEVLKQIFSSARIERFDRDEIKNVKELETRMNDFHSGKIDILVGTQMLSKGHNFQRVKLVLVLGIDSQLNFPDFRAMERVYQTLTQVSGRSGRYSQDGLVAIQTNAPENSIFKLIQDHSFYGFYESEVEHRKICECPPFTKIAIINFYSRFQEKLIGHILNHVTIMLKSLIAHHFKEVKLLGPRPAFIEKKSNQYSWTLMLKSQDVHSLHNLLNSFELNYVKTSSISYKVDVDPYFLN